MSDENNTSPWTTPTSHALHMQDLWKQADRVKICSCNYTLWVRGNKKGAPVVEMSWMSGRWDFSYKRVLSLVLGREREREKKAGEVQRRHKDVQHCLRRCVHFLPYADEANLSRLVFEPDCVHRWPDTSVGSDGLANGVLDGQCVGAAVWGPADWCTGSRLALKLNATASPTFVTGGGGGGGYYTVRAVEIESSLCCQLVSTYTNMLLL